MAWKKFKDTLKGELTKARRIATESFMGKSAFVDEIKELENRASSQN